MGKSAMCIQMLQILNSGRVYKASELADLLETNPRNIIEYKKELEEAGYYIISIPGKFGGYQLDKTAIMPSLKFTEDEKKAISDGAGYLEARNDFLLKKDFQTAMSKVYSSMRHNEPQVEPLVVSRLPLSMSSEELEARYKAVERCIKKNYEMIIDYTSLVDEQLQRRIQPYKLYSYNNAWYFIGYDVEKADFFYYKLNRVKKYTETSKKFSRRFYYTESDYLDLFGMKQNGEWYPIKLKISDFYAIIVKEHIYGKNQTIEELQGGSVILSCEMQNKDRIESFALSMGKYCEVLEPEWLRESIYNYCVERLKK